MPRQESSLATNLLPPSTALLRGSDLKTTEHLGNLLAQFAVCPHFVVRPSEASPNDLFTEKLGHEGPQSNNMGDSLAVPAPAHSDQIDHVFRAKPTTGSG